MVARKSVASRLAAAVLVALAASALSPAVPALAASAVRVADRFGPLALTDLGGKPASLASLKGKVVVLNFWATWCQPCIEEMPLLAKLAERYRDRGLVIVAASVDEAESRNEVARVAAALPEGMQVWIGATLEDMQRLDLGMSLPVTVVLQRDGTVAQRHRGALRPGMLETQIEALLGGDKEQKRFQGAIEAGASPQSEERRSHEAAAGKPPGAAAQAAGCNL